MHICIYASEVASAVGKNPYQHPVVTLLKCWQRYHQGTHYKAALANISLNTGLCAEDFETARESY